MISSCFRSFNGLVMAALGSWPDGLEKKEGTAGWSFPAFCHVTFSFMSLEKWWNFILWRKGLTPDGLVSSLLNKYICNGKINGSTSFATDNMCYVSSEYKNKRVYLGVVKFKTKDQKFLRILLIFTQIPRTLLIFTQIPLMPKKCGLSISFYEFVQRENERVSNTHIHTISWSYKILYIFLHITY